MIAFLQRLLINSLIIFLFFFLAMSFAGEFFTGRTVIVEYGVLAPLAVMSVAMSLLQKKDDT